MLHNIGNYVERTVLICCDLIETNNNLLNWFLWKNWYRKIICFVKWINIIDFSFIHEKVGPLYCADNGRPAIDPTVLFKMIFLGYFHGIRSERQLEREIQTNLAYRWFLGLGLADKVPDHTTISK
ncbi:hypothetical protein A9P44_05435 [Paenibacillus polymyxa]|nr:hypothetical protein A9P44_05435 [Paenibacillus polymyxa]